MAHFEEQADQPYDWNQGGVYVIEREDPVDGGLEGVSNRQGRELTRRTRNLHGRLAAAEGEIDTLQEELPIAAEAAKRSAMEHTDQTAAAVRDELAVGDQAALRSAKDYADMIVAALVDGSPELLNTLEELAAALGNDPNFATTVMTEIGKRATMSEVNTALAGKANTNHAHNAVAGLEWYKMDGSGLEGGHYLRARRTNPIEADTRLYLCVGDNWNDKVAVHKADKADNVPWAGVSGKPNATNSTAGLMSGVDKAKLDGIDPNLLVKWAGHENPTGGLPAVPYYDYPAVVGMNIGNVEVSVMLNMPAWHGYVAQLRLSDYLGRLSASIRGSNSKTWHELYGTHNLKIIRGAVDAGGGLIGGSGFDRVYKTGNYVRVEHYLGHTNYSATASVHSSNPALYDNVVSVAAKYNNYIDFVITDGPGNNIEFAPFDFIIIPW